jgi:hypothetical protein
MPQCSKTAETSGCFAVPFSYSAWRLTPTIRDNVFHEGSSMKSPPSRWAVPILHAPTTGLARNPANPTFAIYPPFRMFDQIRAKIRKYIAGTRVSLV